MIVVKPTNDSECRLPSGLVIEGETEVEKTIEIARALRFQDLVQVEKFIEVEEIEASADVVDDTEANEEE